MTIEMLGAKFGRLTVISHAGHKGSALCWLCRCECGKEKVVRGNDLRSKNTTSCGCLRVELGRERGSGSRKHGESANGGSNSVEYQAWAQMLTRCRNPKDKRYPDYGGRGIAVCERWHVYENFLADMGRRPVNEPGRRMYSLDRINNDGNYEPDNCRWATSKEQNNNQRRRKAAPPQRLIEIDGVSRTLTEWTTLTGVPRKTFYNRCTAGKSLKEALGVQDAPAVLNEG
jgi:hypothetical protein